MKVVTPAGMVTCWIGPDMVLIMGKMTLSLEPESVTTAPPAGAAAVSVSVAVVDCPPFTETGFTVIVLSVAAVDELEEELELELDDAVELLPQAAKLASVTHSRPPIKKGLTRSIHSPRDWSPRKLVDCNRSDAGEKVRVARIRRRHTRGAAPGSQPGKPLSRGVKWPEYRVAPGTWLEVIPVISRLACTLASSWLLFAPPGESGLRYHARIELPAALSVVVWVDGERARMEIQTSNEPSLAAGTVLLTSDSGENLIVLDPAKQEFFSLPHGLITRFKQREADRLRITYGPISSEKMAEDPGPVLAGYPTRHLRFHIRLATHQTASAGESTTQIEVYEHFWVNDEIRQRNTDLAMLADSSGIGFPALDEFLRNQAGDLPGFILKRNLVMTVDDSLQNHQVIRTAYEITELAVTDSPASQFQVPDNFHMRVPQHGQSAPSRPSP
ncbi:MAG TPA: hypothetical protein VEC95_02970 [Terriglobales bacterium]|nr:hypothetical protein [Terriglobales bacterium]